MSYRLETPRPRPPPIFTPSEDQSSLLYDLPPVTSPTARSAFTSTSSPSPSRRKRFKSPPPSAPSRALQSDLETFEAQCRAWYYNQDDEAGRLMTKTLTTLPPPQRAPFAKLQASIRSGYHASVANRRNAEYHAHLSATIPGGSLSAHSRLDPSGLAARKERYQRFENFLRTWCTAGMPGTQPFFEGLWAVMRLQVVPINLGGAGSRRIAWEVDDAVFKEAAGKDFMLEAINVLKGVLTFEEVAAPVSRCSSLLVSNSTTPVHSRARSQPLSTHQKSTQLPKSPPISTAFSKRPRASSDPFLDGPTPPLSRSIATTSSASSNNQAFELGDDGSNRAPHDNDIFGTESSPRDPFVEDERQLRIWTSPDISNPEYLVLLKLFPAFVSRHQLPRFPVDNTSTRKPDIEEGGEADEEAQTVRFGTGTITLSAQERSSGWQGSWWTRFMMWWRTLFC